MSELTKAFIKAQSEFPRIGKDGSADTGKFSYTYATLPSVMNAVLPVLHKHGLALMQTFEGGSIVTSLLHEGGEVSESSIGYPTSGVNPQDLGKWITYLRRYAIVAMLGLAPDDDDDATGVGAPPPRQSAPPKQTPPPQVDPVQAAVERVLTDDRDLVKAYQPDVATLAAARQAVLKALSVLKTDDGMSADEIYKTIRGYMNSVIDERAAAQAGF